MWSRLATTTLLYAVVGLSAFLMVFPFLWLLSTSLKSDGEALMIPPVWIPNPILWENYQRAWEALPFGRAYLNSIYIAILVTLVQLLTCAMAAYGFARIRFWGRDVIFVLFLATLMVPFQVTLVPSFILFKQIAWVNTHLPLLVPPMLTNAFGVFLLRQFIMTLPLELEEAAVMDGANRAHLFGLITLPLIGPGLAALGIFTFLGTWNAFLAPLIFLNSSELFTVPILLNSFRGLYNTAWPLVMAASAISVIPVLVVYVTLQQYFIQGIALTGLKG
ncbi:MAG: carbohydrate ABC transporter permease [Chloroflexi bacterium]|nr:carbohydrate ABC transporter permease [Chloroflexota bacterium]